jgi:predicted dehydrogenase
MTARLGVGIVGAGNIGAKRAAAIAASPSASLVAVSDSDPERAASLAGKFGAEAASTEELIARNDVDAVIVATPHRWLAPVALAALRAEKHVLAEKPLAMTAAAAAELVAAAEASHRVLKTGFNHRCHRAVAEARALAATGRIGRLMHVRCRYGHGGRPGYASEWRANPVESGGGELMDQGVHAFDLFRWFLGEFAEVYAMLTRAFWPMPVEDNAFCTLRTPAGQVAQLHVSWTQWKNIFSFEVFGERGYLLIEGLGGSYGEERLIIGRRRDQSGAPEEEVREFRGADNSWAAEWTEFETAIREERETSGSGRDGWQALRLVEAAYASAREGRTVRIEGESDEQQRLHREVSWGSGGNRRAARS